MRHTDDKFVFKLIGNEEQVQWIAAKAALSLAHRELIGYVCSTLPSQLRLDELLRLRQSFDFASVHVAKLRSQYMRRIP